MIDDFDLSIDPALVEKFTAKVLADPSMRAKLDPKRTVVVKQIMPVDALDMRRRDVDLHIVTDRKDMAHRVKSMLVGHYFVVNKEHEIYVRNLVYRQKQREAVQISVEVFKYAKVKYYKVTRLKDKPILIKPVY